MIITTTNILDGVSPVAISGASSDLPENVTREDFSYNYTSSSQFLFKLSFGATVSINYVAIAGMLLGDTTEIVILDGGTKIKRVTLKRNHCVVLSFEAQTFTDLIVAFIPNGFAPTVSYISAGQSFVVPNGGETAGYNRAWLERGIKQKTTMNGQAAPISSLTKRIPLKGRLNLPNMLKLFTEDEWQDFLDFGYGGIFFINEDADKPESSYVCHQLERSTVKSHGQTTALNNVSASFKIYNGL